MPLILIKDKIDTDYLSKVDRKIINISQKELNNSRFGFNNKVDFKTSEILNDLKELYIKAQYGSDCLGDICLSEIRFYIDRITNAYC